MHWHAQSAAACMRADSLQSRPTLSDPWTVARQAPLSVGFSRREYWSGLPFPPPGDLPHAGMETASLVSPALAGGFFTNCAPYEAHKLLNLKSILLPLDQDALLG